MQHHVRARHEESTVDGASDQSHPYPLTNKKKNARYRNYPAAEHEAESNIVTCGAPREQIALRGPCTLAVGVARQRLFCQRHCTNRRQLGREKEPQRFSPTGTCAHPTIPKEGRTRHQPRRSSHIIRTRPVGGRKITRKIFFQKPLTLVGEHQTHQTPSTLSVCQAEGFGCLDYPPARPYSPAPDVCVVRPRLGDNAEIASTPLA